MNQEPKPEQSKNRDELAREIMRAANKLNWSAQAALNGEAEPIDEKAYAAILEWRDKVNLAVTSLGLRVTQENRQKKDAPAEIEMETEMPLPIPTREVIEEEPLARERLPA